MMQTKVKFLVLATALMAVGFGCASTTSTTDAYRELAGGKCDPEAFVQRIRKKGCYLSNNDERRITHNAEYCKQLATHFQIVTMENSGDVVVLDTRDCERTKYEVDSKGIDQLKIIQDYAYMSSNDGQLYIFSSHSKDFFELRSNSGNSYSKANHSNVTEINGNVGGTKVYSTHANSSKPQEWDSDKINSMDSKRLRRLKFYTYGSNGSVYND
jgi:hypothetical protein